MVWNLDISYRHVPSGTVSDLSTNLTSLIGPKSQKLIVDQSETVKAKNDLQWFFDKLDRYFNLFFLCDSFYFFDNRKMQIAKRRKRNPLDTIYYSNNLWNFTHIKRTRNRFKFFWGQRSFKVKILLDEPKNLKIFEIFELWKFWLSRKSIWLGRN